MNEHRSVEINFTKLGHSPDTFVKVDGKKVGHVTRVTLDLEVSRTPKVTIEMLATDGYVRIDEADVSIEPHVITREARS